MNCIFCDILSGKSPAHLLYRDEHVAAFMDIQPVNRGHLLVVPVKHAAGLEDLDPEDGRRIFSLAQRLSAAIRKSGLKCEGINFFLADGKAAMQEVFHVHLHVFPRFKNDGFGLCFSDGYFRKPPFDSLKTDADRIRRSLPDK